jgi:hypothetical protein
MGSLAGSDIPLLLAEEKESQASSDGIQAALTALVG